VSGETNRHANMHTSHAEHTPAYRALASRHRAGDAEEPSAIPSRAPLDFATWRLPSRSRPRRRTDANRTPATRCRRPSNVRAPNLGVTDIFPSTVLVACHQRGGHSPR